MSNGCLSLLTFGLLGRGRASTNRPLENPYGLRDDFLSHAELSFYHVLRSTMTQDVTIVIKPRLADILFVRQPQKNQGARNRIDRKHVDFLLCETATMKPRLVVELDDRSHQKKDRQERDQLVDGALRAAGLPVLHVRAMKGYVPQELFEQIQRAIHNVGSA
jgi:very-short-patch-repair endonuclease